MAPADAQHNGSLIFSTVTGDRKINKHAGRRSASTSIRSLGSRQKVMTGEVRGWLFTPLTIYLLPVTSE